MTPWNSLGELDCWILVAQKSNSNERSELLGLTWKTQEPSGQQASSSSLSMTQIPPQLVLTTLPSNLPLLRLYAQCHQLPVSFLPNWMTIFIISGFFFLFCYFNKRTVERNLLMYSPVNHKVRLEFIDEVGKLVSKDHASLEKLHQSRKCRFKSLLTRTEAKSWSQPFPCRMDSGDCTLTMALGPLGLLVSEGSYSVRTFLSNFSPLLACQTWGEGN